MLTRPAGAGEHAAAASSHRNPLPPAYESAAGSQRGGAAGRPTGSSWRRWDRRAGKYSGLVAGLRRTSSRLRGLEVVSRHRGAGRDRLRLRGKRLSGRLPLFVGQGLRGDCCVLGGRRTSKAAGAKRLWIAGKPGKDEESDHAAGIDGYLYAGCDALDVLTTTMTVLGVN